MKITNHKDGSRSYTFSNAEQVHGSEEHVKALTEMAICSGGINSMLHCLLCGSEGKHLVSRLGHVGMGTESLTVLLKIAERAKHTPFGQGCLTAALREIEQEDSKTEQQRHVELIFGQPCPHTRIHKTMHEGQYLEQCEDCNEIIN